MPDGTGVAGLADAAHQLPLTADGRFRAGSTGKVLFSAVALQLVAEGRLDLDAPISTWFGARDWFARLPNARAK